MPGAPGTGIRCGGKMHPGICSGRVAERLSRHPPVATAHQHGRGHRHRAAWRTADPEVHDPTSPRKAARARQGGTRTIRQRICPHSAPGPNDLLQSWPHEERAWGGALNTSRASRPWCYAPVTSLSADVGGRYQHTGQSWHHPCPLSNADRADARWPRGVNARNAADAEMIRPVVCLPPDSGSWA